ncbi:hypothetical protein [Sulfobacillus harzensis]|uniref:Uncharacterized protein n=1 Tax=Sulfobacillus harzensis TaxID=2729629 RepID=A0A7Y0L0H1_9FIRM|nr:hypothetical protein [Sulfobacillus harzensis]NMP20773.1 hypothetical protein [Sulfobacillus harzensis]
MDRIDASQKHVFTLPEGSWTLKRLGMLDEQRVAGQATLMLGCPFDEAPLRSREIAWMWATITVATVDEPKNWDWNAQPDTTVLETLYTQYIEWDRSFRRPVDGDAGVTRGDAGAEPPLLVSPAVPDSAE